MSSISSLLSSVVQSQLTGLTVDTTLQPAPVDVDLTAPSSGPAPGLILRLVRPSITLTGPSGNYTVAPWGTPDSRAPAFIALGVLTLVAGLSVYGAIKLFGR